MVDNTGRQRMQKRRKILNSAAKALGYPSWSAFETSVINYHSAAAAGPVSFPHRRSKEGSSKFPAGCVMKQVRDTDTD